MTELLDRIRAYIEQRTLRERWLVVLVLCVIAMITVHSIWVGPLRARSAQLEGEVDTLELQLLKSQALIRSVRRLQGEVARIEELINASERTDLLSLLQSLAEQAGLTDEQIDSVTPKPASSNASYTETRVEVRLKGTTLNQTVDFLYRIENAPQHLIVRSLRITTVGKKQQVLNVSFSVSSFERSA